jgi:uncharacterized protein (TIGR00255 family)
MTGYASAQQNAPAPVSSADSKPANTARLGLEIRCVNSRFLDMTFRLPEELRAFEPALRQLLAGKLKRGKVEVRAFIEQSAVALGDPTPALLQRLNSLQDNVRAWLPTANPLSVADVLRLAAQEQSTPHDWSKVVLPLAEKVVKDLGSARQREGARLALMLKDRSRELAQLTAQAVPLVPQLVAQHRQRFVERWNEALALSQTSGQATVSAESAQDRALTEATAFAIRIDVAEEVTRLDSHLKEIDRLIDAGGEIGKRLDFLIQELHREANTLGSKSAALELTHISVDMKVLIEQMREQVQNIE